jgi:nucleoside-diphosphate-sugar epimerase
MCRKVAVVKLTDTPAIEIWGDGEQARSFCYIDDCVIGLQADGVRLHQADQFGPRPSD